MTAGVLRLSKKWPCHFFEKASLRSAPQLSADSGQFDAHYAQSVFRHAHVAAENRSYCFRICGRETLRGFFDILTCARREAPPGTALKMRVKSTLQTYSSNTTVGGMTNSRINTIPQIGEARNTK